MVRPNKQDGIQIVRGTVVSIVRPKVKKGKPSKQRAKDKAVEKLSNPIVTSVLCVMGIYNKFYNKWFLISQESGKEAPPVWFNEMKTSQHRLALRKVSFDAGLGLYEYTKCSQFLTAEENFQLIALHEIIEVKGALTTAD